MAFFLIGITIRGIPEIIIQSYPVGYETITQYAPVINTFQNKILTDVAIENYKAGSLLYILLYIAFSTTGMKSFILLKLAGPLLYGCLVASFFLFLRMGMNFDRKTSAITSLILTFQVAVLRLSWDRLRNVLALIFFFSALIALCSDKLKYRLGWILGFSVLTALSREYVVFLLFVIAVSYGFLAKQEKKRSFMKLVIVLIPAFIIFMTMFKSPRFELGGFLGNSMSLSNYLFRIQDAVLIFLLCYIPILPFVLKGFRKHKLLIPFLIFLLLGSFSVVFPLFYMPGYQRWLMLLVFPFCIYAAFGIKELVNGVALKKIIVILIVFTSIGTGYVSGLIAYGGLLPNSYIPLDLTQSSIPWDQVDDVRNILSWLDKNAPNGSVILAEERFYGWTQIYLERAKIDITIFSYSANSPPWDALAIASEGNSNQLFLIWYTNSSYDGFNTVYTQKSISTYKFEL